MSLPLFADPTPNQEQPPEEFDATIIRFIDFLNEYANAGNNLAGQLNALVNAKNYNAGTTYNETGWDQPDAVWGSDGYTYACIGTDVSGDDPVSSSTGNWVRLMLREEDFLEDLPAGVKMTGGIVGGDVTRTGDNELTFAAMRCRDEDDLIWMTLDAEQAVDTSGYTTANQWLHFFLCDDGVVRIDTDVDGSTLAASYSIRRRFSWPNNSSGSLKLGVANKDTLLFGYNEENILANTTTTWAQVDHSSFIPESIVEAILYGTYDSGSTQGNVNSSIDGTNVESRIGYSGGEATSSNAWGASFYTAGWLPYSSDRYFSNDAGYGGLLIHALRFKV